MDYNLQLRDTEQLKKTNKTHLYAACKRLTSEDISKPHRLKVKGWKNICPANGSEEKSGVTILTSDKIDFKTNTVIKDKEWNYIIIWRLIQQILPNL